MLITKNQLDIDGRILSGSLFLYKVLGFIEKRVILGEDKRKNLYGGFKK